MPESRPQSGGARAREPEVYRVISRIHVGAPDPVAVSVARGRLYRAWPFCIIAGLRQERQLRSFAVMKTFSAKQADIKRDWYVVDATGKTLGRSEEHTSELQSRENLVCRLLLEKKKKFLLT